MNKIPNVGDIYKFSYAHTLGFSAIVIGITAKTVQFQEVKESILDDSFSPSDRTIISKPSDLKLEKKFRAFKTSFDEEGNVSCTYNDSFGSPWNGKEITRTRYY